MQIQLKLIEGIPKLSSIPFPELLVKTNNCKLIVEDENGKDLSFNFSPYQAVRVTTSDCFIMPGDTRTSVGRIAEVINSNWVEELTSNNKQIDESATFMEKAHHFLIPGGDNFFEIIAWGFTWEYSQ